MTKKQHLDGNGTNVLAIVMKVIGVAITATVAIVSAVSAYFNIIGKIDRLELALAQQAKTMASIKAAADDAINSNDLLAFCLRAQISNKGWVCPLGEQVKAPRRIAKQPTG